MFNNHFNYTKTVSKLLISGKRLSIERGERVVLGLRSPPKHYINIFVCINLTISLENQKQNELMNKFS